jgi:hypothetical protein
VVKDNFGLVTLMIIVVSLLPLLWMMFLTTSRWEPRG